MARVNISQLKVGTSSAADFNTILTTVAAETSNVDSENMQQGGLDGSVLQPTSVNLRAFPSVLNTPTGTQALSTTWVTCDPGGINPIQSGSFSLDSDELVRIRGSVELLSDGTNPGLPGGDQFDLRVGFQHNGGPIASITPEVGATTSSSSDAAVRVPIFAVISGATFSGTINLVELQVSDQSGNAATVQYGRVQLQGTIFKRVV